MAYIPILNQSVSGTVGASVVGLPPVNLNVGGNPVTTANPVPVQPPASGSLPVINIGSVISVNQGSIGAVIIGGSILTSSTPNQSVSGAVSVSNFPTTQNVSGSVVVFGTVGASIIGQAVASGSYGNVPIVIRPHDAGAFGDDYANNPQNYVDENYNQILQPNYPFVFNGSTWDRQRGNSSIGTLVSTARSSVITVPQGSIAAVIIGGSVASAGVANQSVSGAVSVSNFPTNQNVSGSVIAFPTGTQTVVSSLAGGIFPISGSVAAVITNTNVNVSGSVAAFLRGTVITSVSGNVGTTQAGTRITSIVGSIPSSLLTGNYGFRNDAVASFLGGNLTWRQIATDSAGRTVNKPFAPEESRIEGYHSVVSTSVTTLVATAGAGLRNYITDIVLVNTGATTTLVTFRSGGGTSILGYGIAPAGGGSNMLGFATPMRTLANETFDFQPTTATSVLFATVKGFKAP